MKRNFKSLENFEIIGKVLPRVKINFGDCFKFGSYVNFNRGAYIKLVSHQALSGKYLRVAGNKSILIYVNIIISRWQQQYHVNQGGSFGNTGCAFGEYGIIEIMDVLICRKVEKRAGLIKPVMLINLHIFDSFRRPYYLALVFMASE